MSKLVRKGTAHAGKISELDLAVIWLFSFGPMGATVTAVRNSDGNLELIKWDVSADGTSIKRLGDVQAGAMSEVAMTVVHYHVITAVRNSAGKLEVISWSQDLVREHTAYGDEATEIAICAFDYEDIPDHFAVAYRDSNGKLKVLVWTISNDGTPTLRGTASAGSVQEVALAFIGSTVNGYRFVTAVKNGNGDLELIQWFTSSDGTSVQRLGSIVAGTASDISVQADYELVMTGNRNGSGNLELITWRAHASGDLHRLDTSLAGSMSALASAQSYDHAAPPVDFLTTAVRNGSNDLELIDWRIDPSAGTLTRTASATAGAASIVRVASAWNSQNPATVNPAPQTILITAVRNGSNDLELISWARE